MEVEQLQRVIENLTGDCESLKRQVAAEKDCARNLEYIIKTGRKQVYYVIWKLFVISFCSQFEVLF